MSEKVQVPQYVQDALARESIDCGTLLFASKTDFIQENKYGELWVLCDESNLFLFEITNPPPIEILTRKVKFVNYVNKFKTKIFRPVEKMPTPKHFDCKGVLQKKFGLNELDNPKLEKFITGGMLTSTTNGYPQALCYFSNSCEKSIQQLLEFIEKKKKNDPELNSKQEENGSEKRCLLCNSIVNKKESIYCDNCLKSRSLFLRVLQFMPRYKKELWLISICMVASSLLGLASPYLGGAVFFDQVLNPQGKYHGKAIQVILLMALSQLLSVTLGIIYGRINAKFTARCIFDLKSDVFVALQRLSLKFFDTKRTGSLITSVNDNAMQLQYFFHDGLPYLIVNLISVISIGIIMLLLNWKLTLMIGIPVPFVLYLLKRIYPKVHILFSKRYRTSSYMNSLVIDNLNGIKVVKAFGKEHDEINRFSITNNDIKNIDLQIGRVGSFVFPFMGFLMGIGGVIVWAIGSFQIVHGIITLGTLMTFTGYITLIYSKIEFLANVPDWWTSSMNAASRIFEIIDTPQDVPENPNPKNITFKGNISFDHVNFGYEPGRNVLHDITLEINAGETLGLVGHSGAGKTTLVNLITRLYDCNNGEIRIDGIPIKELSHSCLRSQIGIVLQETYLFTGTIAENIAYSRPDASLEEIIKASQTANAHNFICKLPDGYETIIGKKSYNLSGGEKQRISIARAILSNPKILIFDEATSSVDTETELLIQEALERLLKGRTVIAIAHRLSTLRNADKIVVIDKGKIIESGKHGELLNIPDGAYASMIQKQRENLKLLEAI